MPTILKPCHEDYTAINGTSAFWMSNSVVQVANKVFGSFIVAYYSLY